MLMWEKRLWSEVMAWGSWMPPVLGAFKGMTLLSPSGPVEDELVGECFLCVQGS